MTATQIDLCAQCLASQLSVGIIPYLLCRYDTGLKCRRISICVCFCCTYSVLTYSVVKEI